jgi:plasmid maintenance system antidote protein VapI
MKPREYFLEYVQQQGGIPQTAAKLDIPYPTLCSICNGYRGISKEMADRMAKADPFLDANRLVWVRPTKTENPKRKNAA